MATLLEKGIIAARNGNPTEAKGYLVQVLQQDSNNEQAWLWMSEVVDTIGEQIACVEQVLQINPGNQTARLALQKLKSQPVQRAIAPPQPALTPAAANILYAADTASLAPVAVQADAGQAETRRPFRLSDAPNAPVTVPLAAGQTAHRQATVAMPPMPWPDPPNGRHLLSGKPVPSSVTQGLPKKNGLAAPQKTASNAKEEAMPLVPLILFGTLSFTAAGGLFMIVLLIAFG